MKTMYVFNTLSRKKEPLVPVKEGHVGIYACGPTVYNFFHIGNARPFVIFDTLRRFLVHLGYDVKFVQNFTDIDDKMIRRANEEDTTVEAIADKYIEEYFKDAAALGVKPADVHPRATKHIGEIIGLIKKLEAKGLAYAVDNGDVYFDTQAWRANYDSTGELTATVTAYSPVTGASYSMRCNDNGSYIACTGGNNAVVYVA